MLIFPILGIILALKYCLYPFAVYSFTLALQNDSIHISYHSSSVGLALLRKAQRFKISCASSYSLIAFFNFSLHSVLVLASIYFTCFLPFSSTPALNLPSHLPSFRFLSVPIPLFLLAIMILLSFFKTTISQRRSFIQHIQYTKLLQTIVYNYC